MKHFSLSLLLFFGIVGLNAVNSENVPAFLWGTDTSSYSPALQTYDAQNFLSLVTGEQRANTVTIVFFENNLSTEDITMCKREDGSTCFAYLKSINPKTYLSSVENPVTNLRLLSESQKSVAASINADGEITSSSDIVPGSFVFVSLADDQQGETNIDKFIRHDAAIKQFIENLSADLEVLAIYTGNHAGVVKHKLHKRQAVDPVPEAANPAPEAVDPVPEVVDPAPAASTEAPTAAPSTTTASTLPGKLPTADTDSEAKLFNLTDVLVVFESLQSLSANNDWANLSISAMDLVKNGSTYMIKASTSDGDFTFDIASKFGGWDLENFHLNGKAYRTEKISVNRGFSYHCGPGIMLSSKEAEHRLKWIGLQIEPNFYSDAALESFSDAWDCVGFVSASIWGGLFVIFILIGILTCGLSWIYDIKTMDRFDDPKGKTIIVTETD